MDICVPSGNFGNILGGVVAKQMGLPVGEKSLDFVMNTDSIESIHAVLSLQIV